MLQCEGAISYQSELKKNLDIEVIIGYTKPVVQFLWAKKTYLVYVGYYLIHFNEYKFGQHGVQSWFRLIKILRLY